MSSQSKHRILIVDDDSEFRRSLKEILTYTDMDLKQHLK